MMSYKTGNYDLKIACFKFKLVATSLSNIKNIH